MLSTLVYQYVSTSRTRVLAYLRTKSWITWLAYPLSYNLTGFIILTSSYSSCRFYFTNWYTSIIKSITLSSPSLSLFLKILSISRLFIRGIVSSYLIYCYPSLIPPSVTSIHYATLITLILSISKVMPSCSYYIKKGLVYIIIVSPSSH